MPKILIVEDDPMISEIYEKKFEQAGFEVTIAEDGRQVLKEVSKDNFDIVLLDMVLPEMSGLDILAELKSGKYSREMRVIIFSNLSEVSDKEKAFEKGADGYITKTQFTPSDLVKEIQRMLGEFNEQKNNKEKRENGNNGKDACKNKNILLIEDEDVFVDMFGSKLKDDGYCVEIAKNGAWGVKAAMEKDFDLIIMDMVMPAMTGEEMVKRLKLEDKTKNIPIIMLSATLGEAEMKKVKDLGVGEFYEKTRIVPSELSKRVSEILK
ncbi:MAG: hypothetical protein A3E91_02860 [Candidatus Moranbacteria bacterium RIFCSPHIGHO2_12_FULL_40_10]|nr:MAG: hypothetical protein A3E91_02860 [Candidatus Moranbacteria bacterium RIFCSPHIGHO2_12_FULL_40_10]